MENPMVFTTLEDLTFEGITFAHSLAADHYAASLDTHQAKCANQLKNQGILQIGFVEENPLVASGPLGKFLFEENSIFILPPECSLSVYPQKVDQFHRHTVVEFAVTCQAKRTDICTPPKGKTVTLPLYIAPAAENSELFKLIRSIACAKTGQYARSYFEECAEFMLLIQKLSERASQFQAGTDTASPGNRRHCIRAKAFISENIDRRLTVGDIAKAIGVSKNYLTNVFSSTEGIPLMEYINRSKLSYMMLLIRRYGYTLAQAGKHVGYTDVNYISRIFRRYYGMTVTEYKRSLEREEQTK